MKRLVPTSFVALALASCQRAPEPPAVEHAPETPRVEVRPTCPADAPALPAFALTGDASIAERLHPEVLPQPKRGHCVQEDDVFAVPGAGSRNASTIETARGPYLAIHHVRAATALPQPKLALVASDTGLWAHDAETMARLARLVPNRVVDVVATPDGARFAYVRQDPPTGDTEARRELVVVDAPSLAIVRRLPNAPEGRMRIASDGTTILFARGTDGVTTIDVASGTNTTFHTHERADDAITLPERPKVVAIVGNDNAVAFHDLQSRADLPQSTAGELPLVATRDLLSVGYDPTTHRILAGGADDQVHEYEGMLSEHPHDVRQVGLRGDVVDVVPGTEGAIVATTNTVNVAWIKDGHITREIGPLVIEAGGAPTTVSVVGTSTVVGTVGRAFTWTRDGFFVLPDIFTGQEVARATQGDDTILVLRTLGSLEFHRVPSRGGLDVDTVVLGSGDWSIVDATLEATGNARLFVGRSFGQMAVAFVPPTGNAKVVVGPLMGVNAHPVVAARGDGVHWGAWDLESQIVEIDANAQTLRAVQRIAGPPPHSIRLSFENDHWKVVDETGATRELSPVVEPPPAPPRPRR